MTFLDIKRLAFIHAFFSARRIFPPSTNLRHDGIADLRAQRRAREPQREGEN